MIKKLSLKLKDQKGFTLLELLAVIVILGIIAAIAIPSITNVISSSKEKAKVADALSIIAAAKVYNADKTTVDTTITATELEPYLDRVKDNTFELKVTQTAQKTYKYEIKLHEVTDVPGVTNDGTADKYVAEDTLSTWSN